MRARTVLIAAALAAGSLTLPAGCRKKARHVKIGTGGVTGVYYPTGGAIAKLVNRKQDTYGIRATAESTGGSVFNINSVLTGDLDFGIAQSDRQYQAVHGLAEWRQRGPQKDLRAVCSLHPEAVTLVAADDSGIVTLAGLKGKKVNIGNPGSGQRGNALDVLRAAGIDWREDIIAEGLKAAEAAQALQDGLIDAFFYTVGHPSAAILEATAGQRRKVHFVPVTGMDKLIEQRPYYTRATIPIRLYPKAGNRQDVPTIGVTATVIAAASTGDEAVYAVTKEIFENLDELGGVHACLSQLQKPEMLQHLSAPLHPGAVRYYKEAGLMK